MVYSYLLSFFLRIHVTKPLSSPPSIIKETEYYLLIFRSEFHTWNPIFGFRIFMWEMLFLTTLTWNREVCPVSRGFRNSKMHVYSDWTITTKTYAPKIQFFWICHFSLSTVNLCGKMHKRLCLLNLVFYAWTSCANHVLKICATCEKLHHNFYWILNMYVILR